VRLLATNILWCPAGTAAVPEGLEHITPEALATVKAAIANSEKDKKVEVTKKAVPRKAAGQSWEDPTLADWPESKISNSLLSTCLIHNVSEILNFVVYGIFNLAM